MTDIGSTVCNFVSSWTINGNQRRVTLDSGGNARSVDRDSYQTSCMICMCDGTAPSGECPQNPDRSEGTRHYYRHMDNNGMNYAQAQGSCTGQLSMARFDTQAQFNHIKQLVGKCQKIQVTLCKMMIFLAKATSHIHQKFYLEIVLYTIIYFLHFPPQIHQVTNVSQT